MKRLSLALDNLVVETFETAAPSETRGTVRAHEGSNAGSGLCSCDGVICDTYTCRCTDFPTCPYSCAESCPNTCDTCGATCISCMNTCEGYGCTAASPCIE